MRINEQKLEHIKECYTPGTRIKLIRMEDKQAPAPGTCGTVVAVDDLGDILMNWDDGSSLKLIIGVDLFQIVK